MRRILAALLLLFAYTDSYASFKLGGSGTPPPVSGSIALNEIAVDRIFQRVGTTKTITFSGTYTGNPDAVQVQITDAGSSAVLVAYTTVTSTFSGGTWSGTLSVPQYDGWMKWSAKITSVGGSTKTSTNQFGVGALVAFTGQSINSVKWAFKTGSPPTPNANTRRYAGNGWKTVAAAPVAGEVNFALGTSVQGGDGIAEFVNLMHTQLGINIGVLEYAVSASTSAQWAQGGTKYVQFIGPGSSAPFGITYTDVGGDAEFDIHDQGQYEANNSIAASTWTTNMDSFYAGLKANTRSTIALGMEIIGWNLNGLGTEATWNAIQNAQQTWITNNSTYAFLDATTNECGLNASDLIHCLAASNLNISYRMAQSYAKYLSLVSYSGVGPVISTVKWASASPKNITVNLTPSSGFAIQDGAGGTGGSLNGFRLFDNGVALTISSTAISGNAVVLTTSANIPQADVDAGLVKLDYEYGRTPHGTSNPPSLANFVYDTSTPQGFSGGIPMGPTNGQLTATEP